MFIDENPIIVRALNIAEGIDIRQLERTHVLATQPLTLRIREGCYAVVFRYGTTVLFNMAPHEESAWLRELTNFAKEPLREPVVEETQLYIEPEGKEGIEGNKLVVRALSLQQMQLMAQVLAKSVVLDSYEQRATRTFERIEPLAQRLMQLGSRGVRTQDLLKLIGEVLVHQQKMVDRVEVSEKPDLLWDHPELERFYLRLEDEFEIRERDVALERKLELITRTAQTVLDVVQTKRSLRVEWYIVALIVVEIILSLYTLFFQNGGH